MNGFSWCRFGLVLLSTGCGARATLDDATDVIPDSSETPATPPAPAASSDDVPDTAVPAVPIGDVALPALLPPADVASIALGAAFGCAVLADRTVRCWGENDSFQQGVVPSSVCHTGAEHPRPHACTTTPTPVLSLGGVKQVAAGKSHACALGTDGFVRCWGNNDSGQVGDGTTTSTGAPTYVLGGVVAISAGDRDTCAVMRDTTVRCWGSNDFGQLGSGATGEPLLTPAAVAGLRATQIDVSGTFACARGVDGTASCWGLNYNGQLGAGTLPGKNGHALGVTPVSGLRGIAQIATGGEHACASLDNGTVWCWGSNTNSQIGTGGRTLVPVLVPGLSDVIGVAAGTFHSCARKRDGAVWCWGLNHFGEIGDGTRNLATAPKLIRLPEPALQVSAGNASSCARTKSGVFCWGSNTRGELGDGTTEDRLTPTRTKL